MTGPDHRGDRGRLASPDFVAGDGLVLETLDWLDEFADLAPSHVDLVKLTILRAAVHGWAGQPIPDELPPPIDHAALETVHKAGLCSWCFESLSDRRSDFNAGTGHPACARYAYECLSGDGAMPWPLAEPGVYEQPAFLERLARAAVKHRLSARRLELAIKEALRG